MQNVELNECFFYYLGFGYLRAQATAGRIQEWVFVLLCGTADPKLVMRDSGYGEQNWATICGKQQDPLGSKSHI